MPQSALIITCPLCGTVRDHDVKKTLPRVRDLPVFEAAVARRRSGQTAGYRIRVRCCVDCGQDFETAEMPKETLDAFLSEFAELRDARRKTQAEFETLRAAVATLDVTLGTEARRRRKAEIKARVAEREKKRTDQST